METVREFGVESGRITSARFKDFLQTEASDRNRLFTSLESIISKMDVHSNTPPSLFQYPSFRKCFALIRVDETQRGSILGSYDRNFKNVLQLFPT